MLNLKISIIKMFLLFFRHELSICLISKNLNFTITELFLKGLVVKFYHQKEFRHKDCSLCKSENTKYGGIC